MGSHYSAHIESQNIMVILFESSGDENGSTLAPRTPDLLKRKFMLSYILLLCPFSYGKTWDGTELYFQDVHMIFSNEINPLLTWPVRERSGSVVECWTRTEGPRVRASPASLRCGP